MRIKVIVPFPMDEEGVRDRSAPLDEIVFTRLAGV